MNPQANNILITQVQDRDLLIEHARSSYNFTFVSMHEWLLATFYVIIGLLFLFVFDTIRYAGFVFLGIGIWELMKFPGRINRWVAKKEKEKLFNKKMSFKLGVSELEISVDEEKRSLNYDTMRKCLISDTGILFKVSYLEYYYISFKSLNDSHSKKNIIALLQSGFKQQKIKIKNNIKF